MLRAQVDALEAAHPDLIAPANIGCYAYLGQEACVPVVHWAELLVSQVWARLSGGDGSPWAGGST
ncbi:MAG: hypothetical protein LC647_02645 [Beggiatoa sp.]|nr:hypothetical protein [Beggiatoa sp.]